MRRPNLSITWGEIADACARGTAAFLSVFSLMNSVALLAGAARQEDLWWIDLRFLPAALSSAIALAIAALMLAYAVAPVMSQWRRAATLLATAVATLVALYNSWVFFEVWSQGAIAPAVPLPFSLVVVAAILFIAWRVWLNDSTVSGWKPAARAGFVVLLWIVVFPLVQLTFFGMTDYRQPADMAVVLGAKVHDDGTLSVSLADRVRTGVVLYEEGMVDTLLMSGGTGANGIDEAEAMREFAVEMGVPGEDVLLDRSGINTDATASNTCDIMQDQGVQDVLVVSHFYHLPRIKLAFRALGEDVRTVPAVETRRIPQTPRIVAREVPAFWVYWLRAWVRDVSA